MYHPRPSLVYCVLNMINQHYSNDCVYRTNKINIQRSVKRNKILINKINSNNFKTKKIFNRFPNETHKSKSKCYS